jgi:hypothetical protein
VNPRRWWTRQRRRQKRKKAAQATQNEPLREFVYLDEVSVFSLLASRIGALATDFTATESSSLSSEVKSQAGVSTPVARAGVSGGVKASQSSGTQVMRKSTVQSTFRELRGYVRDSLVMSVGVDSDDHPRIVSIDDLLRHAERSDGWVIDAAALKRGQLLEVEVALDADDTFRASTIFGTLFGFLKELPNAVDREGLGAAVTGMRVLDALLAGLVPVRGRSLGYSHVSVRDRELLVHQSVLKDMPQSGQVVIRPLYIVGVAEADLFWRDLRRVLFSGSHYRMLCRLGRDGVRIDWTPVKLIDVLEGAVPSLRGVVDQIPALLAQIGEQADSESEPVRQMRDALTNYAIALSVHGGHELTTGDLASRGLPTDEQCHRHDSTEERREAFREVYVLLASELRLDIDRVSLARLRTEAMVDAGMLGGSTSFGSRDVSAASGAAEQARFLDCEIIAVYW